MNERYLYRGKRTKDGLWVAGCHTYDGAGNALIEEITSLDMYEAWHEVEPDTVGQCTGRKFCGELAFEGDIFHDSECEMDIVIEWSDDSAAFMAINVSDGESLYLCEYGEKDIWRIGNRWDNPELLEGGREA